jgi:hypothetical protein
MNEQIVTNQELLVSNMLEIQALIRILTKKCINNEGEILDRQGMIKRISQDNYI